MASMTKAKQSRVRLKARACNYLSPFALKKNHLGVPSVDLGILRKPS